MRADTRGSVDARNFEERTFEALALDAADRIDCVLAAGNLTDLPGLRAWCEALPEQSYGQVFIEVFSPIQIETLHTPAGVSVTWICRELLRPSALPGAGMKIGPARGEALVTAVDAWLNEWYRPESGTERHFKMWMGARGNEVVHSFWQGVEQELAQASGAPRPQMQPAQPSAN